MTPHQILATHRALGGLLHQAESTDDAGRLPAVMRELHGTLERHFGLPLRPATSVWRRGAAGCAKPSWPRHDTACGRTSAGRASFLTDTYAIDLGGD